MTTTVRLKTIANVIRRVASAGANRSFVGLANIESSTGRYIQTELVDDPLDSDGEAGSVFLRGDVLFGKLRPYLAKVWVADRSGTCSTDLLPITPSLGVDSRYLGYRLLEQSFIREVDALASGAKMPRTEWGEIGSLKIVTLAESDQPRAVAFLDREVERIDRLVEEKEGFVQLLTEKRAALISRAVTKGLNPDAPMRETGISWLGKAPAHWSIRKLGHIARIGNGSTPSREEPLYWSAGSMPWINSGLLNSPVVLGADRTVTDLALKECHLPILSEGSVLVALTGQGKTRGMTSVLGIRATVSQHVGYVTFSGTGVDPEFAAWVLRSLYLFLRLDSDSAGGTKGAITCEQLRDLRIQLAPLEEQREIAAFIVDQTARIDRLVDSTGETISLLKERRSALISAAVTGRLDLETGTENRAQSSDLVGAL
jgi:type I restriction enzyme, S subunit